MNKTLLSLACTVFLGGVSAVSAHVPAYYNGELVYVDLDVDRDGIPDQYDSRDDRYTNNGSLIRYDRYGNRLDSVQRYSVQRYSGNCDGCVVVGPVITDTTRYYDAPPYIEPYGYQYTRWEVGTTLPAGYVADQ